MHTAICTYRVRRGEEQPFETLLVQHCPTLSRFGLVTSESSQLFRGQDAKGPYYVEILDWIDVNAPDEAEKTPEVMKLWEGMGKLTEARDGRPPMEFPIVERLRQ